MEQRMIDGVIMGAGVTATSAGVLFYLGRLVFRRVVRDGLETVKDRAEGDFVRGVVSENRELRSRYDDMTARYTDAMRLVGELTAKVEAQTATINRLETEVERLGHTIQAQHDRIERLLGFFEATT